MNELKPCACGNPVTVNYICGFGGGLDKLVKNPFAGSMPAYYIECDKCGRNMVVRLRAANERHRDQCKRQLIKAWNEVKTDD